VNTPFGPCWRRYNHDGYGQQANGEPYQGWGYGHAWPVLTESEAITSWPRLAMLDLLSRRWKALPLKPSCWPEQVWALPSLPQAHMTFGRSTGGAMPLVWAHAEYMQLVRSVTDGQVFSMIPEVASRYAKRRAAPPMEIWKFNRQVGSLPAGGTLRIQTDSPFRLHWTCDEWKNAQKWTPGPSDRP